MAQALGCEALSFDELETVLGSFDFIVNTVPARVRTEGMLCLVQPEALLLELKAEALLSEYGPRAQKIADAVRESLRRRTNG